jgi:sec-independent protein translocase protein TatA
MPFLVFQSLGPAELVIILAIVVVLFGASRIGDIGGSIGRGIREFRREVKEGEQEPEEEKAAAGTSEEKKAAAETSEEKKA